MPNKELFKSESGKLLIPTNALNFEGKKAYSFSKEHTLAQYAATGCLNDVFYATSKDQLSFVLDLCKDLDTSFIAKVAIYSRSKGYMKDMPALLLAVISHKDVSILKKVFFKVITNVKMLRNYVQIMRSGVVGRKSFGSAPKKLIIHFLESLTDDELFRGSIGNCPSLVDVIKMVHPKPSTKSREALYGYLLGKEYNKKYLPKIVKDYESFKSEKTELIPNVSFEMLTQNKLTEDQWGKIAAGATWTQTRMNLNTFNRHGVFKDKKLVSLLANKLRNKELIKQAKVFPYQIMTSYINITEEIPVEIANALQDALEIAIENVPVINGKVFVFPDVSGSMMHSVTGVRYGATSKVRCIDVAALIAASFLRKNSETTIIPFAEDIKTVRINGRDSVMTNASLLSSIGGGGTNCSAPLAFLNRKGIKGDLIIYVSDNQSWVDSDFRNFNRSTSLVKHWSEFKRNNPKAKLVAVDITPYETTQIPDKNNDIINIGGWSDQMFNIISDFVNEELTEETWTNHIDSIKL